MLLFSIKFLFESDKHSKCATVPAELYAVALRFPATTPSGGAAVLESVSQRASGDASATRFSRDFSMERPPEER